MSEAEVELHLAERWDWNDPDGRERAGAHLDRAMELDPEDPQAYLGRAALADASEGQAQAAAWLSRALDVAPENLGVLRSELLFRLTRPELPARTRPPTSEIVAALEQTATTALELLARHQLGAQGDTMKAR